MKEVEIRGIASCHPPWRSDPLIVHDGDDGDGDGDDNDNFEE